MHTTLRAWARGLAVVVAVGAAVVLPSAAASAASTASVVQVVSVTTGPAPMVAAATAPGDWYWT
jgi:hypothetical protein